MLLMHCVLLVWTAQYAVAEETPCPTIIKKEEWDGREHDHAKYLIHPIDLVIIQHTVTQTCSNDKDCAEVVRNVQQVHMDQSYLWDIGPSFLVAGTGKVYEGRGWNRVAMHTTGFNNQSIGIAFIGNYNNHDPTTEALESAKSLIKCGEEKKRLSKDHKVVIHSQLIKTESPGKKLAKHITTWADWVEDVSEIKKLANKEEQQQTGEVQTRSSEMILTSPKQIDLFSNIRDGIAELIANLTALAHMTLKATAEFSARITTQAKLFAEALASGMKDINDKFFKLVGPISSIPGAKQCLTPIENEAKALFADTEAKAKGCADQRVKEVDDMVKNLGTLSSDVINYAKTTIAETKNCTELNDGISEPTKECLNSVTKQTEGFAKTYESQRTLVLKTIETSLHALPAALELCSKKHLAEATAESNKFAKSITGCSTKLPLLPTNKFSVG